MSKPFGFVFARQGSRGGPKRDSTFLVRKAMHRAGDRCGHAKSWSGHGTDFANGLNIAGPIGAEVPNKFAILSGFDQKVEKGGVER